MLNTRRCVNKVPRRFSLLSNFNHRYFFPIACLWMSIGINAVECLIIGVYSLKVFFFAGNFILLFDLLTRIAFFAICDSISLWYFALCFLWDVIAYIKVSKTSETSRSFENKILSRAIQSAFEINIAQVFITVVAVKCRAPEKVHAYHVPSRKRPERLTRGYLKGLKL